MPRSKSDAARVKKLCGEFDPAVGTLISDLNDRGMLNDTLVI